MSRVTFSPASCLAIAPQLTASCNLVKSTNVYYNSPGIILQEVHMHKFGWSAAVVAAALMVAGCETMPNKTVQGAVAGGALGAGTGAIIGHQTGRAGEGTAIGAGLGALGGALGGHAMDNQEKKAQQQYPTSTTTAPAQANA